MFTEADLNAGMELFRTECQTEYEIVFRNGLVKGTYELNYLIPCYPAPVGVLWFSFETQSHAIEIINIYVSENARRLRVATNLHEWLENEYSKAPIVTGHSTGDGKLWLQSLGYEITTWGWALKRKEGWHND